MPTIELDQFQPIFEEICQKKIKCVMIFSGKIDQNGSCWCSDCQQMAPYYKIIQDAATKASLPTYKFVVGDSSCWKDVQHKYRKNVVLRVTNIPTIGIFDGTKLTNTLIQSEIGDEQKRNQLYAKFNS